MSSNNPDDQQRQNLLKIAIAEISKLKDRTKVKEFIHLLAVQEDTGAEQNE